MTVPGPLFTASCGFLEGESGLIIVFIGTIRVKRSRLRPEILESRSKMSADCWGMTLLLRIYTR
jgi:hypothetical protein